MIRLPQDFKEFLELLNSKGVEYLLVGGHAVAYFGYPRPTGDLDVWVAQSPENAARLVQAVREFGFNVPNLREELFLRDDQIVQMGNPPLRIDVMTTISGVNFADCYARREVIELDSTPVSVISLDDLKANKTASNRHKDLDDLQNLT
jgi:predicted nucleotidyltransferase